MVFRHWLMVAAVALVAAAAVADEAPPEIRISIADAVLGPPPPSAIMPTMRIAPEVAGASVAGGIIHLIKPEIVAQSVEGTVRALVEVVPARRVTDGNRGRGLNGAIGRRLLPGVTIKAP